MPMIDGVGVSQPTPRQSVETQQPQDVTVKSHGQNVQYQPSISSMVADAAEESTQMLQEKSSSSLSKREARSKSASRVREIMQKYLKSVAGVSQAEKFEQLAESLKKLGNATPEQIRQQLEEYRQGSGDDNFESALLLALEELFAAEGGNDDLLAAVREVKKQVGAELQDFYQQQVKSYEDINDAYKELLGEHGEKDFESAIDTMITDLGNDLQSQGSSVDSTKVKSTVDTLYHLEVAKNTFASFSLLVEKMQSLFGS